MRSKDFVQVGKEVDDGAGEPVALVGGVGTAPVVLDGEGERGPEVKGDGDALFELGLAGCFGEGDGELVTASLAFLDRCRKAYLGWG